MIQRDSKDLLFSMDGIETIPTSGGPISETCNSGALAEMTVATEAAKRGFSVFMPFGHAHKADMILWSPPSQPITIQVKKATWQKGA